MIGLSNKFKNMCLFIAKVDGFSVYGDALRVIVSTKYSSELK